MVTCPLMGSVWFAPSILFVVEASPAWRQPTFGWHTDSEPARPCYPLRPVVLVCDFGYSRSGSCQTDAAEALRRAAATSLVRAARRSREPDDGLDLRRTRRR